MSDSIMLVKSKDFAVDVVKVCRSVKSNDMTRQLIRSGTSIGANIHESKYAQVSEPKPRLYLQNSIKHI